MNYNIYNTRYSQNLYKRIRIYGHLDQSQLTMTKYIFIMHFRRTSNAPYALVNVAENMVYISVGESFFADIWILGYSGRKV